MTLSCYFFNIEPWIFWPVLLIFLIFVAILYNTYVRWNCGKFTGENVNLEGKTVLITGANGGLGKETAKYMAKRGCRLIMACRNLKTAKEAKEEIIAESKNQNVEIYQLDLSSFESIRAFAKKVMQEEKRLDILIHNAAYSGVFNKNRSVDGLELTMAINVYGPFLLTNLLVDLMSKSESSKIIMVGSKAHTLLPFNPNKENDLNPVDFWPPLWLYAKSKFAGVMLTYELARRLQGTGITANILHPGTCDSPIWDKAPFPYSIIVHIARMFMKTTEQGIQTILHVALSSEVQGVTGKYYRDCKIGKSHRKTYNIDNQTVLWQAAEKIVQLTPSDSKILNSVNGVDILVDK